MPTTLRTRPPEPTLGSTHEVRARSKERYAVSVDEIVADMHERREAVGTDSTDNLLIGDVPLEGTDP